MGVFNTTKPHGPAVWTRDGGWRPAGGLPPHIQRILTQPNPKPKGKP
jgi:hypothetical protein